MYMYKYVSRSRLWSGASKVERCDEISVEWGTAPTEEDAPAYVVPMIRTSHATPGLSM